MKLKEIDREILSDRDKQVLDEAIEMFNDCNRWAEMYEMSYRVQSDLLEETILSASHIMRHTLEYYGDIC